MIQAEENQKKADRLYELKMRELDERACELQRAEEACRNAVIQATKDFNKAQVSLIISLFVLNSNDPLSQF